MTRSALRTSLVVLLVLTLVPAVATAAPPGKAADSGVSALAADSAAPDAYEPDGHGTASIPWTSLEDLGPLVPRMAVDIPGWGKSPYTETHTIDLASASSTDWDEDWWKLTVTADDMAFSGLSYRLDAFTLDPAIDIVLDVYGASHLFSQANAIFGEDPAALASNDDSPWSQTLYGVPGRSSSVTFIPAAAGTYWVRVRPFWHGAPNNFTGHAGTYTLRVKCGQIERIAGADRIATAIKTAQEGWPTQVAKSQETTVVLAYGMNYPDALAAASLAGACGTPILLTTGDHLPVAVRDEILRLGVKGAYVVGGTGVIGNTVIEDLQVILDASRIKRVAGVDRYTTAIEVMKTTKAVIEGKGGTFSGTVFLASGANYPDALAIGPIAYQSGSPVLLTAPADLTPAVASAIAMYGFDDVIVAGGTGAVSANAVNGLVDDGIPVNRILRVAGSNRYETAKEIAAWACDLKGPGARGDAWIGTVNNTMALRPLPNPKYNLYASGEGYADALAGGPFAGKVGAPLLLTPKWVDTPFLFGADGEIPVGSTQWFADLAMNTKLPIEMSYLLGGTGAVTDAVYGSLDANTGWNP